MEPCFDGGLTSKFIQEIYHEIMTEKKDLFLGKQLVMSNIKFMQSLQKLVYEDHYGKFIDKLKALIYESRDVKTESSAKAAANAISLLVSCNFSFFGANLSGVRIMDADLRDGVFNGCDFSRADLSRVDFSNSKLDRALFKNTILNGATFSDQQSFEVYEGLQTCSLSADGKVILLGLNNGKIKIIDRSGNLVNLIDGIEEREEISPDGDKVVNGCPYSQLKIWTRSDLNTLNKFEYNYKKTAFSNDGQKFLNGISGVLTIRETKSGKLLRNLRINHLSNPNPTCLAFSRDEKLLASGWSDKSLIIFDFIEGKIKKEINLDCDFESLCFSPNGEYLALGAFEKVLLYRMTDFNLQRTWGKYNYSIVKAICFSEDGAYLLSAIEVNYFVDKDDQEGNIKLWTLNDDKMVRSFGKTKDTVSSLLFSPDGTTFLSNSPDGSINLWDFKTGEILRSLSSSIDGKISASLDWSKVFVHDYSGNAIVFNLKNGEVLEKVNMTTSPTQAVFSQDQKHILSFTKGVNGGETVKLWDGESGNLLMRLGKGVKNVIFSKSGYPFLLECQESTIELWDAQNGVFATHKNHEAFSKNMTLSPNGLTFAGVLENMIKTWNSKAGELLNNFEGHTSTVISIEFSSDSEKLVSTSDDNTIKIWTVASGQILRTIAAGKNMVSAGFSNDGNLIIGLNSYWFKIWQQDDSVMGPVTFSGFFCYNVNASFSSDDKEIIIPTILNSNPYHAVKLWKTEKLISAKKYEGHIENVVCVDFSSDGKHFVSGGKDKQVKVWDCETGKLVKSYETLFPLTSIAFQPKTSLFASGQENSKIQLWSIENGLVKTFTFEYYIESVVFSHDGLSLLFASGNDMILINVNDGKILKSVKTNMEFSKKAAFLANDNMLIVNCNFSSTILSIYDKSGGDSGKKVTYEIETSAVAVSREGTIIVVGAKDKIEILDDQLNQINTFKAPFCDNILCVALSKDDKKVASGQYDGNILIWERLSGNLLEILKGHQELINSVAFSHDGMSLASVSFDQTVKLWEKTKEDVFLCKFTSSKKATKFTSNDVRIIDVIGISDRELASLQQ